MTKVGRLFLGIGLIGFAGACPAKACTDGIVREYFAYSRPSPTGGVTLVVTILHINREQSIVRARLEGGFASLTADGTIRIVLPDPPYGDNCVELGPIDGRVLVSGTPGRSSSGELTLFAFQ